MKLSEPKRKALEILAGHPNGIEQSGSGIAWQTLWSLRKQEYITLIWNPNGGVNTKWKATKAGLEVIGRATVESN